MCGWNGLAGRGQAKLGHIEVVLRKAIGQPPRVHMLIEVPSKNELIALLFPNLELCYQLFEENSAGRTEISLGLEVTLMLFKHRKAFG